MADLPTSAHDFSPLPQHNDLLTEEEQRVAALHAYPDLRTSTPLADCGFIDLPSTHCVTILQGMSYQGLAEGVHSFYINQEASRRSAQYLAVVVVLLCGPLLFSVIGATSPSIFFVLLFCLLPITARLTLPPDSYRVTLSEDLMQCEISRRGFLRPRSTSYRIVQEQPFSVVQVRFCDDCGDEAQWVLSLQTEAGPVFLASDDTPASHYALIDALQNCS